MNPLYSSPEAGTQQNPTNLTTSTAAANQNHESETAEGETA